MGDAFKMKVGAGPEGQPDPGSYRLVCIDIREDQADFPPGPFGPGGLTDIYKWKFAIPSEDDWEVEGTTTRSTGPKSKNAEFIAAMLGPEALEPGAEYGPSDFIGKACIGVLKLSNSGWLKVESVMAAPKEGRRAPVAAAAPTRQSKVAVEDDPLDDLPF